MSTRKWFLLFLLLVILACGSGLISPDWPPAHWLYGEVGVLMGAVGTPPHVLRAGLKLPPKTGQTRCALFSPRRLRHWSAGPGGLAVRLRDETADEIARGGRVIVDTTRSDLGRLLEPARTQVFQMKEAGIIRMVIWDGAHHLPSLRLRPEVIVLPVMADRSARYWVCHGTLRDAVPLEALLELIDRIGWKGWVIAVPRLSTLAKADRSLAFLADRILHSIQCSSPSRARPETDNLMPENEVGTIYESGDWVLTASEIPFDRLPEMLARGRQDGAVRLWAALASDEQLTVLHRLCKRHAFNLKVIGYPLGVKDLLFKR